MNNITNIAGLRAALSLGRTWYAFLFGLIFSTIAYVPSALCQTVDTYRVYLSNKGIAPFVPGSTVYNETKDLLSDRCLKRRAKVLPKDSLFSIQDAPLYAPYVDDIKKTGAVVLLRLRWSNYVVVECDSSTANMLRSKPYVRAVTRTAELFKTLAANTAPSEYSSSALSTVSLDTGCGSFRYGPSYRQNNMLGATTLHSMGITGSGVLMGMIDNGFRWRAHDCFNNLNIVAEYDYMFNDSLTGNDSLDVPSQDGHGSACLSIAAGFLPDSIIGTAPGVSVLLAKTEDMRYERRIEEDRYAAAIEWFESRGVDVSSSSVGYYDLDSTDISYSFDSLNGRASICARAVNIATSLGMICVTAAGNSGGSEKTIITPGDADSAFTVGAFRDDSLNVAGFTSKGPNAAGLIKPDFATLGSDVITMNLSGRTAISAGKGTSFATPALAGGIALLLSQFPSLTPYTVRSLLRQASSQSVPDNAVGYGLPNIMKAAERHNIVVSPLVTFPGSWYQTVVFHLRSEYALTSASITVQRPGIPDQVLPLQASSIPNQFYTRVPFGNPQNAFSLTLTVGDSIRSRAFPESGSITVRDGETRIPCGISVEDLVSDVPYADEGTGGQNDWPSAVSFGTPFVSVGNATSDGTLDICDMLGRSVYSQSVSDTSNLVNISFLQRGLYNITLRKGTSYTFRTLLIF
jgi:hypothetical protein